MEVTRTKDLNVLPFIKPLLEEFIKQEETTEYDVKKFLQYIRTNMSSPNLLIWVASGNKDEQFVVDGFSIATVSADMSGAFVSISCLYGNSEETEKLILESMESWMRRNAIDVIAFTTKFPEKKFINYGFSVDNHFMVKSI